MKRMVDRRKRRNHGWDDCKDVLNEEPIVLRKPDWRIGKRTNCYICWPLAIVIARNKARAKVSMSFESLASDFTFDNPGKRLK